MGVQIVLHEDDLLGFCKMDIAQLFEDMSIIFRCALVFDLHAAPAFKRGEQHEQALHAAPFIFIIVTRRLSWLHGDGRSGFGDQLF